MLKGESDNYRSRQTKTSNSNRKEVHSSRYQAKTLDLSK
mgnify:CR=1 FL=1